MSGPPDTGACALLKNHPCRPLGVHFEKFGASEAHKLREKDREREKKRERERERERERDKEVAKEGEKEMGC